MSSNVNIKSKKQLMKQKREASKQKKIRENVRLRKLYLLKKREKR